MSSDAISIGITGSTGVLGRALLTSWCQIDKQVKFVPFQGDIEKSSDIDQWLKSIDHIDAIIHLAAVVPTEKVEKDPLDAFRVNTLGTLNLLESCRQHFSQGKSPWIFFASTSHVYSSTENQECVSETSPLNPISTYGLTKAQADQWTEIYRTKYRMPICTGRIFSYSSPNQASTFFIPSMIVKLQKAPQNSELQIRGLDGTRDFVTMKQIIEMIFFLFMKKAIGIFNIGTGNSLKLFDLVQCLKEKLNRNDITITSTGTDTHHLVADMQKLNHLGFHLSFDINQLLKSFFDDK